MSKEVCGLAMARSKSSPGLPEVELPSSGGGTVARVSSAGSRHAEGHSHEPQLRVLEVLEDAQNLSLNNVVISDQVHQQPKEPSVPRYMQPTKQTSFPNGTSQRPMTTDGFSISPSSAAMTRSSGGGKKLAAQNSSVRHDEKKRSPSTDRRLRLSASGKGELVPTVARRQRSV